jgi:hypothetical protein
MRRDPSKKDLSFPGADVGDVANRTRHLLEDRAVADPLMNGARDAFSNRFRRANAGLRPLGVGRSRKPCDCPSVELNLPRAGSLHFVRGLFGRTYANRASQASAAMSSSCGRSRCRKMAPACCPGSRWGRSINAEALGPRRRGVRRKPRRGKLEGMPST